jgi:hypothetical protein
VCDRSLAHWRAVVRAEVMFVRFKGPQRTSTIAEDGFLANPTADHATEAGTRVSAARRCRPIRVNMAGVAHLVGLGIIIVATGVPLRATGDYFLDGRE